ncbi:MAG: hypothetical protein IPK78_19875 [Rhodospirillales bacterium]|nr:hypothetical protein [Rhodospirillales bacterium]
MDGLASGRDGGGMGGSASRTPLGRDRILALVRGLEDVGVKAWRYSAERDRDPLLDWVHRTFFWNLSYAEFTRSDEALIEHLEQACKGYQQRGLARHWAYDKALHEGLVAVTRAEIWRYRQQALETRS